MLGCLYNSGSGECSYVEGTVDLAEEWHNSSQYNWLVDMAAIGEGDRSGAGSRMGNRGRPNMSARAWHRL
jgi:hypothetical protein